MSATQNNAPATPDSEEESHEGVIRTPKQLIWTIILSFVLPVVIIILLVSFVALDDKPAAGSDGLGEEAVARRLQPVGAVEIRDLSSPAAMRSGEQVYNAVCTACHGIGVAGAPKTGDEAAWAPRLKTGYDALLAAVLNGKGAMPKQSGGDFADYEIARAVVFLANKGGGKFDEPKAPAAPAAAASAPK
jgi:cytochrome c5